MHLFADYLHDIFGKAFCIVAISLSPFSIFYSEANVFGNCVQVDDLDLKLISCGRITRLEGLPDKDLAPAYNNISYVYAKKEKFDLAMDAVNRAIELDDEYVPAYLSRGALNVKLGFFHQAISDYNLAARFEPDSAGPYLYRGSVYFHLGNDKKALADLSHSIELDPSNVTPYLYRSDVYKRIGNLAAARSDLEKAAKLKPNEPTVYSSRALILLKECRYHEAIEDYNKAIGLSLDSAILYSYRAQAYAKIGALGDSLRDSNVAVAMLPKDSKILTNRATIKGRYGIYREAITDYLNAISLDQRNAGAYNGLSWILATAPDPSIRDGAMAVRYAQRAVLLSGDLNFQDTLAAAWAEVGDFEKAIDIQEQIIKIEKNSSGDRYEVFQRRLQGYRVGKPHRSRAIRSRTLPESTSCQ